MKKILLILLSVSLLLCLCACGKNQEPTEPSKETDPTVVTDPTTETDPTVDDGKVTYTVTVTNGQGTPISGVIVQLCQGESCIPAVADADGTATWTLPEAEYKASVTSMPASFTYATEETEFHFAEGETALTIVLKAVEEAVPEN